MLDEIGVSLDSWTGSLPLETWIELTPEHGPNLDRELRDGSLAGSPTIAAITRMIRRSLSRFGVAIVQNLPVGDWSEQEAATVYLTFGTVLGTLREQNSTGDLLHAVTDKTTLGVSAEKAGGSNSKKRIDLHTENARPPHPPDILSLLCLSPARSGGASLLLDGHQVFRELSRDEVMLDLARQPKAFGRHSEDREFPGQADYSPIFWNEAGHVEFRYSRYWLEVAAASAEASLSPTDRALFDRIDEILSRRENIAEVLLRPGDALFIDNRRVMHGRESFEDHLELSRRRRLLRMWIDAADAGISGGNASSDRRT